ncbi:MAG: 30S ribosomal protein S17 [Anaerolineae bacterium]
MPGMRRVLTGRVVSTKMEKTVVVAVESTMQHRLYKKIMRSVKKYLAHDEEQACRDGDLVRIEETRPLSHRKRWQVVEILRRAGA